MKQTILDVVDRKGSINAPELFEYLETKYDYKSDYIEEVVWDLIEENELDLNHKFQIIVD